MNSTDSMAAYRISSTGESSAKFGPCEVCGCWCPEVHHQAAARRYVDADGTPYFSHTGNDFGHEACLLSRRETPAVDYPRKRRA